MRSELRRTLLSRSRRKHSHTGITTCESEKDDKREANRRYRHAVRQRLQTSVPAGALATTDESDDLLLPHWREYGDPWTFGKDGKWFIPTSFPRLDQLMRK